MEDDLYGGDTTLAEGSVDANLYEGLFVGPSSTGHHETYLQHKVDELEELLDARNAELQAVGRKLQDREQQLLNVTADRDVLLRNISCLYKTAKEEMARKQAEINSLRAEVAQVKQHPEQRQQPRGYQPFPTLRLGPDSAHTARHPLTTAAAGSKRGRDAVAEADPQRVGPAHGNGGLHSAAEDAVAKRPRSDWALPATEAVKLDGRAGSAGFVQDSGGVTAVRSQIRTAGGTAGSVSAATAPAAVAQRVIGCPGGGTAVHRPASREGELGEAERMRQQQHKHEQWRRDLNRNNAREDSIPRRDGHSSDPGGNGSPGGSRGAARSDRGGSSQGVGARGHVRGQEDRSEREACRGTRQRESNGADADGRARDVLRGREYTADDIRRDRDLEHQHDRDGLRVSRPQHGLCGSERPGGGESRRDQATGWQQGRDDLGGRLARESRGRERYSGGEDGRRERERERQREREREQEGECDSRGGLGRVRQCVDERPGGGDARRDRDPRRERDGDIRGGARGGGHDRRSEDWERAH